MHYAVICICLAFLLSGCNAAPGRLPQASLEMGSAQTTSPYPSLKQEIDRILQKELLPQTNAGIKIVSLATGETLYENNPAMLMTTASTQKLFTAAAALATLGAERAVETTVSIGSEGRRELYLKGCGDPMLTTDDLRHLAKTVSDSGLPRQKYRLVGDMSCFDDVYWGKGWMWDDEPDPDEMYISPLSVNNNAITVEVRPAGKVGLPAVVKVVPATSYVTIRNTATTSPKESPLAVSVNRRPGDRENIVTVSGTVPNGAAAVAKRLSVWKPELYVMTLFRDLLGSSGVDVGEISFGITPANRQVLAGKTRTVGELVSFMLKESDNLTAESLLKLMAFDATQSAGSAENGVKIIKTYLESKGISTVHQVIVDGSGVSRYNITNAETITALLEGLYKDKLNFPVFLRSLAVAGKDGTLAQRMRNTPAEGNVKAKTGTMRGISALSGYAMTPFGEPLAFSMIIQNYTGSSQVARGVLDKICILLCSLQSTSSLGEKKQKR
jgi:serine-type D-Ala-D-Ala carboxypeptidase/endopeptidase (penicillin-binding protein 4)